MVHPVLRIEEAKPIGAETRRARPPPVGVRGSTLDRLTTSERFVRKAASLPEKSAPPLPFRHESSDTADLARRGPSRALGVPRREPRLEQLRRSWRWGRVQR